MRLRLDILFSGKSLKHFDRFKIGGVTRNARPEVLHEFKRGTFSPFVPADGEQRRDNERELVLKAQMGAELPLESELQRWFPLWGIPI